jgi:photosystem II stability/assembly factor-like uncharacterized protein
MGSTFRLVVVTSLLATCCRAPGDEVDSEPTGPLRWESAGLRGTLITALTLTPAGTILAGTGTGVFRSDNGNEWEESSAGLTTNVVTTFAARSDGSVLVGTTGDIFASNDDGRTWTNFGTTVDSWAHALVEDRAGNVFAGTQHGTFRSTGDGSWVPVHWACDTGWECLANDQAEPSDTFFEVTALAVAADGGVLSAFNSISSVSNSIYRSHDGGDTWEGVHMTTDSVTALATGPNGDVLAGTYGGGVLRATGSGGPWTEVNEGIQNVPINVTSLAELTGGYAFVGLYPRGLYYSKHPEDAWENAELAEDLVPIAVIGDSKGKVFVATRDGVYRSAMR